MVPVIATPRAYETFIESTTHSAELSRDAAGIRYEIGFDLSVLSFSSRYAMRRDGAKAIDILGTDGDFRGARYRFDLTARSDKETLIVFRANQDLAQASPIVLGSLFRREPLFEHGVAVALGLIQVAGMRARAEGVR